MLSSSLRTGKDYSVSLPVNIGELQASDFSGANAVDWKQQQECVIADLGGMVAGGGIQDFLDNLSTWPGGKSFLLEHARRHH